MSLVFRIRRFCLDDGPGIRTTVFFKGCPLACSWCHAPEGISPARQVRIHGARCLGCGECREACPSGGVSPCSACGRCAGRCPSGARTLCGVACPAEALVDRVLVDRHYFRISGGGVTLSGGEPTLQMAGAGALARALKAQGLHLVLETCGHFDWDRFRKELLPFLDLVFFDLKLMDPEAHRRHTGVDNSLILVNLLRTRALIGQRLVVRTPLVPGITDRPGNLRAIKDFLRDAQVREHRLLPFRPPSAESAADGGVSP